MFRNRTVVALPAQTLRRAVVTLSCLLVLLGCAEAQSSPTVPDLVKFSGTISGAPAGSVGVIFALYAEQTGGAPLWQEVQNIAVDANGHYTSLLGSSSSTGIPLEVFSSNEARWLGVQAQGQAEQPRVLLVSVPYALKAADAQTLGGLPASAFLRADVPATASTAYVNTAAVNAAVNKAVSAAISSTAGTLPVFTDGVGGLGNSLVTQSGSNVGINAPYAPATTLDVVGINPTLRIDNYSNNAGDSPNFNFITARGTSSAPLATQNTDNLGQFASAGYNGTAFPGSKVKVTFIATENWTPTANGTAMSFQTTANQTTARKERMRIDNSGNVGIGTSVPTSPLTVAGAIQSTSGGFIFPDGSLQTSAPTVKDHNGNVLGTLLAVSGTDVQIADNGYIVTLGVTGVFPVGDVSSALGLLGIDWTSATCSGTPYLDSGQGSITTNFPSIYTKTVIYSADANALMVPSGTGAVAAASNISIASEELTGYGAPDYTLTDGVSNCINDGGTVVAASGWPLVTINPVTTLGWTIVSGSNPLSVAGPLQLP